MRLVSDYWPRSDTPALPPRGPLLIVSPHMDDAACSCAAFLERSEEIVILTVFAGAPSPPRAGRWDAICGFADSSESLTVRRAEEEAAFAGSPHRVLPLTLLDSQYLDGPRPPGDADEIEAPIRTWVNASEGSTLAIPAGAGRRRSPLLARLGLERRGPIPHPDHVFVREAALQAIVDIPFVEVILYEELPYLWGERGDRAASRAAAALERRAERFELEIDAVAKARRLRAYASQIPHISPHGRRLDDPTSLPPRERYWRLKLS